MSGYSASIGAENQIKLSGDLTMYSIGKDWWLSTEKHMLANLDKQLPLSFDLQALTRSDSAGLAWLINIVRDSQSKGFKVVFKNIPEELANLAKISDASALLPLQ